MPAATLSRITETMIRVPRMRDFPWQTAGVDADALLPVLHQPHHIASRAGARFPGAPDYSRWSASCPDGPRGATVCRMRYNLTRVVRRSLDEDDTHKPAGQCDAKKTQAGPAGMATSGDR